MKLPRRTLAKTAFAGIAGGLLGRGSGPGATAQVEGSAAEEVLRTEVCVVGGGSGGIGAALAAARAGASVILVERESVLGGTGTCAWVCVWQPVMGANGIPRDLYQAMREDPLGVSPGDYAASGMAGRAKNGQLLPKAPGIAYEPRVMDFAAREMLEATGRCQVLPGTTVFRVRLLGDAVRAVEAWHCGTRLRIEAKVFVDATADGDVCAEAGCAFHLGEDPRSRYGEPMAPEEAKPSLNAITLCYRVTDTGSAQKPYLPQGVKEGSCSPGACFTQMPNGDVVINVVSMLKGNALLSGEHSRLLREGQKRVYAHFHALQTGEATRQQWASWAISGVAPRLGVRETRRILGDYVLTEHDCRGGLRRQEHADLVAIADHAIDLHGRRGQHLRLDGPYGIPYRCLLPRGVRNLLITSRAASFSHIAASSCRLQRTLMTLGQAGGTAAALAIRHGVDLRGVDTAELQRRLQAQGVEVGMPPGAS